MRIPLRAARRRLSLGLTIAFCAAAMSAAACGGDDQAAEAQTQQGQQQAVEPIAGDAQQDGSDSAAAQTPATAEQQQSQAQAQAATEQQAQPEAQQEQQAAAEPEPEAAADPAADFDPSTDDLPNGAAIESSVESTDEPQQFRFEAAAGEWVRIKVDGKDGTDPILTLLQPDRTEIAVNDDISSANRDSLLVVQIPVSGRQVIRIAPFDANSTGRFTIRLDRLAVGPDDDNAVMALGARADGVLNTTADVDVFEFQAAAGEQFFVTVDGDTGVDVYAQLFNPEGELVLTDDDGGHGLDSELIFQADQAGAWRVEVLPALNSAGQRQLIGAYRVSTRAGLPTAAIENDAQATELTVAGLTFLQALRDGDAATILALAGPEALTIWGWDSTDDVGRDVNKIQSIGLGGEILQQIPLADVLNSNRGRLYLEFGEGAWFRMELILIGGRWLVDDWAHSIGPPGQSAPEPEAEPQAESDADAAEVSDADDES